MSLLDNNFDSVREMPSRAAWMDSASASLLNDNSIFKSLAKSDEPSWLGAVDLFDSRRVPANVRAESGAEAGPEVKPTRAEEPIPEENPVPVEEPAAEPVPVGEPAAEPVPVGEPAAAEEQTGPRAVEGPPPPGVVVGDTLSGSRPPQNPPPDDAPHVDAAHSARSRSQAHSVAAQVDPAYFEPGPGPDGRNADGTYGAGHHPYNPPTYYADSSNPDMTGHKRAMPTEEPVESTQPIYVPKPAPSAAQEALAAAVRRLKERGITPSQSGGPIGGAFGRGRVAASDSGNQQGG
ncbi:MAG TPA: hypothetical protein EYN91_21190 [Candidatus Melainabacteria bacterium]|nr:hypothetical protein [Candidatus Melainabacteria bacterium]